MEGTAVGPLLNAADTLEDRLRAYEAVLGKAAAKSADLFVRTRRELALNDLYYLLVFVLRRKDLADRNSDKAPEAAEWLFARCKEIQADPDEHIDLWAREHDKTTIVTFGKSIQDILADPEITIGLFSHTRPAAKKFLIPIMREFEENELLKGLFPDVLWANPQKEAPKWSEDDGIVVKRKGNPKEATVEAWGLIDGMPTGAHYALRVYDDIITEKAVTNPEMIAKVTAQWELSLNLGALGGRSRYVGTIYSHADTYTEIIKRGAAIKRIYACTSTGSFPGPPVLMSLNVLTKKRRDMGPKTFATQMLLDPTKGQVNGFLIEWLEGKYYDQRQNEIGNRFNRYIIGDPASKKKKHSDYTAIVVVGLGADENYYVLDWVRDRLRQKERKDALFALHRRWKPIGVGWEEYGLQSDIEYFLEHMEMEHYRFEITPLGGQIAKEDRINGLASLFEDGRIYLPQSLLKTDYEGKSIDVIDAFVNEEYRAWPVPQHDDMLDVLARIRDPALQTKWPLLERTRDDERYARGRTRRRAGSGWAV